MKNYESNILKGFMYNTCKNSVNYISQLITTLFIVLFYNCLFTMMAYVLRYISFLRIMTFLIN